ncbi:MAG: DUF4364 family protein [Clostridia bacterium]|jgi:hypothetical protein|nr:DUF4364 family protein [Clostridia bacterium]NLS86038.1 DUF4364 family protein [Oscillospiraceae bacterium]
MPNNAFTAGVKPGGLNDVTEIRILLCYLIQNAPKPLAKEEIETALLNEQLVNYFEMGDALSDLEKQKLVVYENKRYTTTEKGRGVAESLVTNVPLTVRETALRAVIKAQEFAINEAQNKASIEKIENGYMVKCHIDDIGGEVFSFSIYMPDYEAAQFAKKSFIENGALIYKIMLASMTLDDVLLRELFTERIKKK